VYCAEAGACVGALLRPGNTGLGKDDVAITKGWMWRFRDTIGTKVQVTVRIDAGGDCGALLGGFHDGGARFIAKAKLDFDLAEAIRLTNKKKWKTVDRDAADTHGNVRSHETVRRACARDRSRSRRARGNTATLLRRGHALCDDARGHEAHARAHHPHVAHGALRRAPSPHHSRLAGEGQRSVRERRRTLALVQL